MTLEHAYRHFVRKVSGCTARARQVQVEINDHERWRTRLLTEALISDIWQCWGHFCRWLVLNSCRGTISRKGAAIAARPDENTWQVIGHVAREALRGKKQSANGSISSYRQEPSWGDKDKLIDIVQALGPSNQQTIVTAMGLPLFGPTHLQKVRNACFHKHAENMREVRSLLIHYAAGTINSPADLAWEIVIGRPTLAIYSWIDDMIVIAEYATL